MVLEMSEGFTSTASVTTQSINASYTQAVTTDNGEISNVPAFATIVAFGLGVFITSGGLLLIFLIHRKTAKHASMIMISTLANLTIGAFFDLVFRAPLFAVGENKISDLSPNLCVILILVPDYFMVAIILCLPLLSMERLLRLETKGHLNTRQTRQLFSCLLVVAYSLAFVISILPTTSLFNDEVNTRCNDTLVYGYFFAYVYSAITLVSVILTAVFSVAVIFRLKCRLRHLGTTLRKKIVLKQGTVSAIAITGVLFLALVPFAISLQLNLMCGSKQIGNEYLCEEILIAIVFRLCLSLQKICLIALPFVFLGLNGTMRRRVWLTLKKTKRMENVVTISTTTMTVSRDSISAINSSHHPDDDDDDYITIAEDLSFGKSGDLKGEVKRRCLRQNRNRQSVLDLVDVLSVISEKSESGRSYTVNSSE